jgi:hypothetical protein
MKSKPVQFSIGVLTLLWSVTTVWAQEQAPAPSFKDGDTWQFNITAKGQRTSSSERFTGIYELVFSQGQLKVYEGKTELNIKSEGAGSELLNLIGINAEQPSLKFPLSVGQKWNYEYVNRPIGAREDIKYSVEVTVTGIEQVTTPAGSFKAYKLVRNEQRRVAGRQVRWITTTITYFYSPDTRSVVKSTTVSDDAPGTTDTELIKFTPGK